jgi:hypothetical protein
MTEQTLVPKPERPQNPKRRRVTAAYDRGPRQEEVGRVMAESRAKPAARSAQRDPDMPRHGLSEWFG